MEIEGTFTNGVVVPDAPDQLAEGERVRIVKEANSQPEQASPLAERLLKIAGTAAGLPVDLARNHDHYLHGAPKR